MNTPLTVVCWKWGDTLYSWDHVARLYNGLKRHLHIPWELLCITDDKVGCVSNVPHVGAFPIQFTGGKRNARRLWILSEEARILGSTILQLDLDMIITGDLTPLVHPCPDPFKIWKCAMSSRYRFGLNPSFMLLQAGAHSHIWDRFIRDPEARLLLANRNGWPASDQAIISDTFTRPTSLTTADILCPTWSSSDGIISLRDELKHMYQHPTTQYPLPPSTRLVSFHGRFDPAQFTHLDWVKEHWTGAS